MTHRTQDELQANGSAWLRAVLHAICCPSSQACQMQQEQCESVRCMVQHMFACPPSRCGQTCACGSVTMAMRKVVCHHLQCTNCSCALCNSVHNAGFVSDSASEDTRVHDENTWESESTSSSWVAVNTDQEDEGMGLLGPDAAPSSNDADEGHAAQLEATAELKVFAEFLLHSLLRWQGAPGTLQVNPEELGSLQAGRALLNHVLGTCDRHADACSYPGCGPARHVLLHMVECQDTACLLCNPVKGSFSAAYPSAMPLKAVSKAAHMDNWMQDITDALRQLGI